MAYNTLEQLKQMTPEQLMARKAQLEAEIAQSNAMPKPGPANYVVAGLGGALRGLSGQAPKEQPEVSPLEKMYYAAQLKGTQPQEYTPTTQAEAIEYEKAKAGIRAEAKAIEPKSPSDIKAELSMKEDADKKAFAAQEVKDSALDMLDAIKEAKAGAENFGIKGMIPPIPNTPQAKWHANVDKLLAGKVLDVMNKMKAASRTGATGFGQLNRSELKILQDAATTLKKTLNPKDAIDILDKMETKFKKVAGEESMNNETPEYATEEEAEASGYKGEAIIAGRRARID